MDPTDSVSNHRSSVSEAEPEHAVESTNPVISAEGDTLPIRSRASSVTPGSPAAVEAERINSVSESHPPAPAPPPTALRPEVLEHAYWAEFEEDTSTPNEDELKEIDGADADYSAGDHSYWESNFFRDLDDPEYVPGEKARLTWKLKGVRGTSEAPNRDKIIRSPAAFIGGYWWRIKFYPRGNNVGSLSLYLECSPTFPEPEGKVPETEFTIRRGTPDAALDEIAPDVTIHTSATDDPAAWAEAYRSQYPLATSVADSVQETPTTPWRVSAQIGVIIYNPDEPRTGWMQSSCHQFNPHNLDWGWTYFHGPWDQIHLRRRGQHRALLNNDTLAFDAYIRVVDDPTRSLWWHPSDSEPSWDSLALTGYRPLGDSVINHSAEVAGLASWLHIAPFCKIIQSVDVFEHLTNCEVKPRPLCDALQKLLWQLRRRSQSLQYVDTDGITSILRNLREFSSDVSEFWERLRRTLELELAGTEAAKEFARLFDSPSSDDLQRHLNSGPVNILPTAFNSRICVPADKYQSMRDAMKTYLGAKEGRWSLPPVLHIELGRHALDKAMRWQLMFNKVDLDEELDLTPWVVNDQTGKYVLYGYVVHRGRRTSGKFFSILRPAGPGTKWLAFDDGSDNRVECLTQKTALGPHLGLDPSKPVDHKKGHDIPVVAMYVRCDKVSELLPGPQGPWSVPDTLKQYYETGVYNSDPSDRTPADKSIQVEVYSMSEYEQLGSLFDAYDLMSHAKATNSVLYMSVPSSTRISGLRKKISAWKSAGENSIGPERVRLWHIGHTRAQCGPTLAFDLITDLNVPLDSSDSTLRFWMETISEDDAKLFAIPDPPLVPASEDKLEESVIEQLGSQTFASLPSATDGDAIASSSGSIPAVTESPVPSVGIPSSESNALAAERTEHDAILAVAAAYDQQSVGHATTEDTLATPIAIDPVPPVRAGGTTGSELASETSAESQVTLPVGHAYYFIQLFDPEDQVLRTVGSFFSKLEANVKASIRKHMQWPIRRDFLMWKRVDGTTVTTVSPAENFLDVGVPHGSCIIIGDKLSKDRRSHLGTSGLFSSPDRLIQYLWAKSRNHPIHGFTGNKTVEATFTGDYYNGDFLKGYYHGRGKHLSGTGIVYEGDFVFGKRHGQGKMEYPTGDTYDGDWVDDVRHGQGTYIEKKTGNKYVGGYKDGKRHGKGISYWEVADEEADLCQICYSEEQDAVFCDCGHVCSCVTCAKQVDLCPICRKSIKSVIKIYKT
ncbi:Zinc finger RING-type [Penicillium capsulatum]|uniref:Zinc finger RING-type n=1 Tax=Penicillium capsulatum TaxID=69766 RepID=A0A9W9IPN5_9EURO|nr:Zinc finger RING-type [Penicillium capsulatum]KAJ6130906.1 Zinc finger RING-type [Penicillium capsulatum]